MALEKTTGTNDRSREEIAFWSLGSAAIGAVMGNITAGLSIPGITSGRRSFQHVMRTQFTNMIRYGYNISFKTAGKSFVAMTVLRQVIGNFGKGLFRAVQEWWEYFKNGDILVQGWL